MLQLQAKKDIPPAPEDVNPEILPPSKNTENNYAFIAKKYNIIDFENDTIEISLRERKVDQNIQRRDIDTSVYVLSLNATYRITQMNVDSAGVR